MAAEVGTIMDSKSFRYINIALGIAVFIALMLLLRTICCVMPREEVPVGPSVSVQGPRALEGVAVVEAQKTPSISPSEARSLGDVYANFPKEDAGSNMIEAWKRVKPEEKAKFNEGIDKEIATAKELIASDPSDKKAKHMLFIAETMKKLAADDFNYKIPEEAKKSNI